MIIQRDHLWKTAFHTWMPDFVRFFFADKYDDVDWTKKIFFLDKELNTLILGSRPRNRIADVLVMLHLKNGKKLYILLHIEIQGYFDKDFAFRVHQMRYRIEDKWDTNPVMLSIFTDDDLNFHPKEYAIETWGSGHKTYFNTYKVMENPPSTYKDPDNPVALIMEIVYCSTQIKEASGDAAVMKLFVPIVKKLLSKNYSKEDIRFIISFIEAHVKFGKSENYRIFEQKIDKMVKVQTTAEIAAYYFDTDRRIKDSEIELKKANREIERFRKREERERQKTERERQKAEHERQEKVRERNRAILVMLQKGIDTDIITTAFEITTEEIQAIQEKYKDKKALATLFNRSAKI